MKRVLSFTQEDLNQGHVNYKIDERKVNDLIQEILKEKPERKQIIISL